MELIVQMEYELLETLRVLEPDRQKALLEFAKFLHNRQNSDSVDAVELESSAGEMSFSEGPVDLAEQGISREQAADWRSRLQTFEDDWNHLDMAVYDEI
ncbi:MAG: hypothetical protein AAFR12_07330 [Cyanobacteria bacterium J06626_6]